MSHPDHGRRPPHELCGRGAGPLEPLSRTNEAQATATAQRTGAVLLRDTDRPPHPHRNIPPASCMHCMRPTKPPPPAVQRKGAVLRRGRPVAVQQRQPVVHSNTLKGYSLPSDSTAHTGQPQAQHAFDKRPQHSQARSSTTHRKPPQEPVHGSSGRTTHAVDQPEVLPAAGTDESANHGPAKGRSGLQNGELGAAKQRLTGQKRKLVGAAQQAGIVSGILAERAPASRDSHSDAQAGTFSDDMLCFSCSVGQPRVLTAAAAGLYALEPRIQAAPALPRLSKSQNAPRRR